jgi:hypothetical protein
VLPYLLSYHTLLSLAEISKQFTLRVTDNLSVLPERCSLVVDRLAGTLTLVNWQDEQFLGVCDELTDEQFSLVLTLLEQWPSYVPYEKLLRLIGLELTAQHLEELERVRVSGKAVESEDEQAQNEQARQHLKPVLQTLREEIASCLHALRNLGIDICAVQDHGPLLMRYVDREVGRSQMEEAAG